MPTYVYEYLAGPQKGQVFDHVQLMKDPPITMCPTTGHPVRRVVTSPYIMGDEKARLEKAGFTQYKKSSDGTYEKTAGKGPSRMDPNA